MLPTLARLDQYGTTHTGTRGLQPWRQRVEYETYRSKYGPEYKVMKHFHGINISNGARYAYMAGLFGASAGIFALFFFGEIPRVRNDILEKVPIIGPYFHREVAPEDNPF